MFTRYGHDASSACANLNNCQGSLPKGLSLSSFYEYRTQDQRVEKTLAAQLINDRQQFKPRQTTPEHFFLDHFLSYFSI